jgi:hypothetical protein
MFVDVVAVGKINCIFFPLEIGWRSSLHSEAALVFSE